eukprot:Filipodium_phascolosomae@DN487_c0_g1_i1.p1
MGANNQKPLPEQLRENKRAIQRSIRELDREREKMQIQEKKLIADIKKNAQNNQMGAAKIMAKDLVRTRKHIEKCYEMKSHLSGVSLRLQSVQSTQAMTEAMSGVTKAMVAMNKQVNLPGLQKIMEEYLKEGEKMTLTEDALNDTIDDSLTDATDEAEEERVVSQVLDEIGVDMEGQLVNAPNRTKLSPESALNVDAQEKLLEDRLENLSK